MCKVRARWWLAGCKLSVCAVHRGAIAPEGCLAERPPRGLGWCGWPDGLPPAAVPVGVVWAVPLSGALGCRVRFSGLPRGAEGGVGCGEFCLLWPHRWRLRELHEHGLTTVLSCPCAPSHSLQSCPPTLVVGFPRRFLYNTAVSWSVFPAILRLEEELLPCLVEHVRTADEAESSGTRSVGASSAGSRFAGATGCRVLACRSFPLPTADGCRG